MKPHPAGFSPDGKRVRICAAELGVPLERLTELAKGQNRSLRQSRPSPTSTWPTPPDGSFALWESGALMWYLARKESAESCAHLVPSEPQAEADTLRWLFFCSSHVDPYFTALVVERSIKPRRGAASDEALAAEAERWLARFIPVLERQLAGRDYVTGRFGLADIALGCTFELSSMLEVDLSSYPNIRGWLSRLAKRESWRKATPLS